MAHFAEINNDNYVVRVIVVDDENCLDENGNESEQYGAAFCSQLLGGTWKQCSYNANFRKNFPSIGFKYDQTLDAFIAPQPYPSWTLNEETCVWEPPVEYPSNGKIYFWNENSEIWELSKLEV